MEKYTFKFQKTSRIIAIILFMRYCSFFNVHYGFCGRRQCHKQA